MVVDILGNATSLTLFSTALLATITCCDVSGGGCNGVVGGKCCFNDVGASCRGGCAGDGNEGSGGEVDDVVGESNNDTSCNPQHGCNVSNIVVILSSGPAKDSWTNAS